MNNKIVSVLIGAAVILGSVVGVAFFVTSQQNTMSGDMDMTGSQSGSSDAVMTNTVEISSYKYMPETITVKKGTKVTWTNKDSVAHTVTTQDGSPAKIDSGLFGKDESYSYTFEKTGTYEYFCEPHPYMKATVIVTE